METIEYASVMHKYNNMTNIELVDALIKITSMIKDMENNDVIEMRHKERQLKLMNIIREDITTRLS